MLTAESGVRSGWEPCSAALSPPEFAGNVQNPETSLSSSVQRVLEHMLWTIMVPREIMTLLAVLLGMLVLL